MTTPADLDARINAARREALAIVPLLRKVAEAHEDAAAFCEANAAALGQWPELAAIYADRERASAKWLDKVAGLIEARAAPLVEVEDA